MKKFLKIAITLALLAVIVFGYQFGAVLNDKNELQNKVQKAAPIWTV